MAANSSSVAAIPICLESGFMFCTVFQCVIINIRVLVAVLKEGAGNGFFRLSVACHTQKTPCTVYRFFFSDRLKCEVYCCTLYPLLCSTSRISIPKV